MNLNATGCESKWTKVNDTNSNWSNWFKLTKLKRNNFNELDQFHWQEAIDTIESIDATWQWKTNWLTPRNQACLSKSTPKTNRSICLTWRWCIFEPSMTPFLVGYLSIDTIESSEICGYEETIAKTKSMPSHPSSELSNLKHVTCSTLYQLKQFVTEDAWDKHSKNHWHHKCCKRWHDSPIIDITCHWQIDPIDNKLTHLTNWPNCTTCKQVIWKIC